ncbi:MAG: HAD family hydrolase [Myxococcaceae bacterium]
MAIAFFDFDRTLIAANSAVLWLRSEVRQGNVSRLKALLASAWVARYNLGFSSGRGDGLRIGIAFLAGRLEAELRDRSVAFYDQFVRGLYRPGARVVLEEHRAGGDTLALLTSTTSYIGELVADELQLDAVLCNRFEVDDAGVYTGRPLGELCYGPGKVSHARAFARSRGVSLDQCAFYTDSFSDLPLMLEVGRPVAVNPDARLRREALLRGWETVDWGSPVPEVAAAP